MTAATYDLKLEQGVPLKKSLVISKPDGSLADLTGFTGRLQLRLYDSHPTAVLTLTTENGGISINTSTSTVTLNFSSSDTIDLPFVKYSFDCILYNGDKTFKPIKGFVYITQSSTKPEITGAP